MKKNLIAMLISVSILLSLLPFATANATSNVRVTIPTFEVALNGIYINNTYAQYPLIIYNDVTYIPMTWGYSRFLGLATSWDPGNRDFSVWVSGERSSNPEIITTGYPNNAWSYVATIADYNIYINGGNRINNASEKYPLLNFRGITYFPLTWEYAVEKFGWNYIFTNYDGLKVSLDTINEDVNYSYPEEFDIEKHMGWWTRQFVGDLSSIDGMHLEKIDVNKAQIYYYDMWYTITFISENVAVDVWDAVEELKDVYTFGTDHNGIPMIEIKTVNEKTGEVTNVVTAYRNREDFFR